VIIIAKKPDFEKVRGGEKKKMKILVWLLLFPTLILPYIRSTVDACTSEEEMADLYSLDGSTHPVEGILEEGDRDRYSAEEQIHGGCDAKTLSTRSKTLACESKTSDWEGLEDTRMSSEAGEARISRGRSSTNFDSETECRDDDGAPASGLSTCLCRGCSYSAWDSLLRALEETLPAPDQWPQTVIGDPKLPTLALLEQDYQKPALQPRSDLCAPDTRVVIGVFSQATNFWARQVSRVSWASALETEPQGVCVVYILAQPHTQV